MKETGLTGKRRSTTIAATPDVFTPVGRGLVTVSAPVLTTTMCIGSASQPTAGKAIAAQTHQTWPPLKFDVPFT